jgi:hypothetical protein
MANITLLDGAKNLTIGMNILGSNDGAVRITLRNSTQMIVYGPTFFYRSNLTSISNLNPGSNYFLEVYYGCNGTSTVTVTVAGADFA